MKKAEHYVCTGETSHHLATINSAIKNKKWCDETWDLHKQIYLKYFPY